MYVSSNHAEIEAPLPQIAGYRVLRALNRGFCSSVYQAEQIALHREVAIKVMLPHALADEVSRRRFENEARTIARLEHPYIVSIYEVGRTQDGLPYFVMPYLPRGHLGHRHFIQHGVTDEAAVIATTNTLLDALAYAHSRGVVHRDVKAENVLYDDSERPLLADFGIALRRGYGPRVTSAGLAVGSTAYMAPEQARGEDVDGRADLYSLAVLIWEMLTGQLPYQAGDALSMAVMHAKDPIPKLPLPLRHWQRFMNCALSKYPGKRFEDAAQMRAAMLETQQRRKWPWLTQARDNIDQMLSKPRMWHWRSAAYGIGSAAAVLGAVMLFNNLRERGLFRTDAIEVAPTAASGDPTDAMMAPLPEAPLQAAVAKARKQIAQNKLTSPKSGNAYASVLEAWHVDSSNPEVHAAITELTSALTTATVRNLREGNDARARDYFTHANMLGQRTGNADTKAQSKLREGTTAALKARMDSAIKRHDRAAAERTLTLANEFDLPADVLARYGAQAHAMPRDGATVPGDRNAGVLRESARGAYVISRKPVSRTDFARFVRASGRAPTLCRERASLLRVIAPRDWRSPGFSQGQSEPVVCVSLADAEAYASWYGRQTGHRYRLPSAAEARQTSADMSGRDMSMWLRDCGMTCSQRHTNGVSWRTTQSKRSLLADRGYDDVGFRLVREL